MIATIISFGLAESVLRSLDLFGMSYYRVSQRYERNMLPDPDLVYKHTPNSTETYGYTEVDINSLGMRNREVLDKKPEEYRILFLGDSVTFGWGVAEDQIFVRRLEGILTEQMSRPVHTLNSGVGSYNTESEWEFLKRHGHKLDPNLVVLVYVPNDIAIKPRESIDPNAEWRPPVLVGWALSESWIYSAIMHFSRWGLAPATDVQKTVLATYGWELSDRALRAIAQWCEDRGIPFVTYLARMSKDPASDAILSGLRNAGTEMGFLIFDTQPWFSSRDIRKIMNSIVDTHPNADAHALYAAGIAATLKDAQIIED
jgi:lysophospholipase L1-like esterase